MQERILLKKLRMLMPSSSQEEWRGEIVHISWSPRAFLLKNFLTDEECDHLISKAGHACYQLLLQLMHACMWPAARRPSPAWKSPQ